MFTAKIKGLQQSIKIKEIKDFFKPIKLKDIKIIKNGTGVIFFRNKNDLKLGLIKSGNIQNRPIKVVEQDNEVKDQSELKESVKVLWPVKSEEDLESAIFESGSLSDVHLSFDTWTNKPKGYAFITYMFPVDAIKAFKKLDRTKFMDRLLHILPGQEPLESTGNSKYRVDFNDNLDEGNDQIHKSTFQVNRFDELKNSAGVGHNWNTLFVRPDAVASYLAAKFGLSMEQVLNPSDCGSVAVRLAHGETQLINELRDFLESHGVKLEAFGKNSESDGVNKDTESKGRRNRLEAKSISTVRPLSATAFLIKNLPIGTNRIEVCELLKKYSKQLHEDGYTKAGLKRVLVPLLGITAIVEYGSSQQAKMMYKKLAYEPYKNSALFLQWLPEDALDKCSQSVDGDLDQTMTLTTKSKVGNFDTESSKFEFLTSIPEGAHIESSNTVDDGNDDPNKKHIKCEWNYANAKASTTTTTFDPAGSKRIRKHKNKNEKIRDSAVVESSDIFQPDESVVKLDQSDLRTERDDRKEKIHKPEPLPNRIIILRNVPFQATQKELRDLFHPIGGLINVRLPIKPTGGHRGFAFLEFTTLDQSKTALETMGLATHFLGRHLRLEYANQ